MSLHLNSPPAAEPVTLDQAKAWLKLDTGDEDVLVTTLIGAARARAEWHTGRAFVSQGWTLWLDTWPDGGAAEIPLPPLQSVSSLTFYARDDSATILDPGDYTVDAASQPGRVMLKQWPPGNLRPVNAVAIAFTAGYGAAGAVPGDIAQAILMIAASLYTHRGDDAPPRPDAALALLAPYRMAKL
jgi:uncharacterized phiE125 gp8 family phage protein